MRAVETIADRDGGAACSGSSQSRAVSRPASALVKPALPASFRKVPAATATSERDHPHESGAASDEPFPGTNSAWIWSSDKLVMI